MKKKPLADGFSKTMEVVDKLFAVEVGDIEPASQVTGLENIFRDDVVDVQRSFSQESALQNAKKSYNGFFVIDQLIEQNDN